jgi:hypothetical protein
VLVFLRGTGRQLTLARSKYHVPLQVLNVALTYGAAYLGHHHKGRQFPATVGRLQSRFRTAQANLQVHGIMAKVLIYTMFTVCALPLSELTRSKRQ